MKIALVYVIYHCDILLRIKEMEYTDMEERILKRGQYVPEAKFGLSHVVATPPKVFPTFMKFRANKSRTQFIRVQQLRKHGALLLFPCYNSGKNFNFPDVNYYKSRSENTPSLLIQVSLPNQRDIRNSF